MKLLFITIVECKPGVVILLRGVEEAVQTLVTHGDEVINFEAIEECPDFLFSYGLVVILNWVLYCNNELEKQEQKKFLHFNYFV